jgi:RNA polymerase sigma factor (sigma-70 family)
MKYQRRITKAYFDFGCHQYAPLIQKLAFRVSINKEQIGELKNRAMDELLKCMICYDCSGSFKTFFFGRLFGIFRHMRDAEQKAKRIRIIPLDFMMNMVGPNYDMDSNMMAQECLGCLNEDEYDVITQLFFDERTTREVSDNLGIVASTICRIKTRAIHKMKRKFEVSPA